MGAVPFVASASYFLDRAPRVCGQALGSAGLACEMCLLCSLEAFALGHSACWLLLAVTLG